MQSQYRLGWNTQTKPLTGAVGRQERRQSWAPLSALLGKRKFGTLNWPRSFCSFTRRAVEPRNGSYKKGEVGIPGQGERHSGVKVKIIPG